jgi:hypothetical protein
MGMLLPTQELIAEVLNLVAVCVPFFFGFEMIYRLVHPMA